MDNANKMVDTIRSVKGNGLEYVEELFFQGKEVIVVGWPTMVGWVLRASWRSFTTSDEELIPFSWVRIIG